MCSEPARKALEDLVKHVHRHDEILLVTPETEAVVPGVYEELRSSLKPDNSGHLLIGTKCGKVDIFDEVAVTLRTCQGNSLSHMEWKASTVTRTSDTPDEAPGTTTRGIGPPSRERLRNLLHVPFPSRARTIAHPRTTELRGSGPHILKCPETEGMFLSLRTQITRSEGLARLEVDQFSIHNSRECGVYLNKWSMHVSAGEWADVHDVWPCRPIRVIPREGEIIRNVQLDVSSHDPLVPLGAGISVGRVDRIARGGAVQSWSTNAARDPVNGASLSWDTRLWLEKREARHAFGLYDSATQYLLGEGISEGGFTVDLNPLSPGASFQIPVSYGSEDVESDSVEFEVKLKAHLRGPWRLYNTHKLVEVTQDFRIRNIFERCPALIDQTHRI